MSTLQAPHRGCLRRIRLGCAALCVLLVGACNRDVCLGLHKPTDDRNAPQLLNIELLEPDTNNPWLAVFALEFADRDGDVGNGNLLVYVGASTPVEMSLAPFFETSELALDSVSGRVGIPLSLTPGSMADDTILRFGFQMQDALEHYSRCYVTDLHFDLTLVQFTQAPRRLTKVPCSTLARREMSPLRPRRWLRG